MNDGTPENEPDAVGRVRRRLLAPRIRASKLVRLLVAEHESSARATQRRFLWLASESMKAPDEVATHTAASTEPPSRSVLTAPTHHAADPTNPSEHDDEVSTSKVGATIAPADAGDDRPPLMPTGGVGDSASESGPEWRQGARASVLTQQQRTAIARTARQAAEDALRTVRHKQRTLASEVRACRDEPPAFQ